MNLLIDPWIPIRKGADFGQISYKELLCSEQPELQVALPRDDLELACIQMLAALTQVIFMPKDKKELHERVKTPLSEKEFEEGIEKYKEWFDLDHPKWPFMQTRGVTSDKLTTMQKLMIGMPEKTSTSPFAHCFFNEPTEVLAVCPGVAAIALFNQASNSPSFGGGFKGSLRGAAPISTMINAKNLRDTVWMNILPEDKLEIILPWYEATKENDKPVWVEQILTGEIQPYTIGFFRGLFWQPAHIELVKSDQKQICNVLGGVPQDCYTGFKAERFGFELKAPWVHPYSPRQLLTDGTVKYLKFEGAEPAWTQLTQYLFDSQASGYTPAAVIANHNDSGINLP